MISTEPKLTGLVSLKAEKLAELRSEVTSVDGGVRIGNEQPTKVAVHYALALLLVAFRDLLAVTGA